MTYILVFDRSFVGRVAVLSADRSQITTNWTVVGNEQVFIITNYFNPFYIH